MSVIPAASGSRGVLDGSRFMTWFRDYWISVAAAAVLVWIVVVPLVYLIIFSFRSGTAAAPGDWTLANYAYVYTSSLTYEALGNTLIYTMMVATLSMAIAGGLAWLVERTDMPYRGAAWVMILLPIAMPGMLSSMAWILLLGPRTGLINVVLRVISRAVRLRRRHRPDQHLQPGRNDLRRKRARQHDAVPDAGRRASA